jgi:Winged helix DNA-binding domain
MKALIGLKGTKLTALKWHQVHAWHLSQHGLSPRLNSQDVVQAVRHTGGIQAQVMSATELALCTRVEGLSAQDIRSAIFQDHTLVKTWAMRATLHVLATSDLPLYAAALNFRDFRNWPAYFAYYGISPAQHEALLSAVPQVLGSEPMTREQLAIALAEQTGIAHLRDLILSSSWGSPLKQSALRGDLCFGPKQGQNVTFVNPRAWMDEWPLIEPEQAVREMIRLYLRAYGPATAEDFAHWCWDGGGIIQAKKLFQSMKEELEEADVEGWRAVALRATLEPMQRLEPSETIHLLPLFDAYTIGMPRGREQLLSRAYKSLVFRPQGWISAVVLVNGSIQGIWQSTTRRSQTIVKVQLFCSPTALIQKGIEAEVERLRDFFKTNVLLEYEHLSSSGL